MGFSWSGGSSTTTSKPQVPDFTWAGSDTAGDPSKPVATPKVTSLVADPTANINNIKNLSTDDQVRALQRASKAGVVDKNQATDLITKILSAVKPVSQPLSGAEKVAKAVVGTTRAVADVGGGLLAGATEAVNKGIAQPAGALGGATADLLKGKGFDYRNQYKLQGNQPNPLKQATQAIDKTLGTSITPAVDYTDKNLPEQLVTTGAIGADILTGGALTPVIVPALTAYYGTKYAKGLPDVIKQIAATPDISTKFELGTQMVIQGLMLGKGVKDTAVTAKNLPTTIRNIPQTKEVNTGGTVPNDQARHLRNT